MKRVAVGFALVAAAVGLWALPGSGQSQSKLKAFMRPKLEHSKGVLEGLAVGDFEMIIRHARAMKDLSAAAEWKVSEDVSYLRHSLEFQLLTDTLIDRAKEKNLDGATLAYVKLTMNCVDCHRYFRENPIRFRVPNR